MPAVAAHPVLTHPLWKSLAPAMASMGSVIVPPGSSGPADPARALSLVANWNGMGFFLSSPDILRMASLDSESLNAIHASVTPSLQAAVGGHVRMRPMYPKFPEQVMEASDAELYLNAILHYVGDLFDLRIVPAGDVPERPALPAKDAKQRPLRLLDSAGVTDYFRTLVNMATAWTPAQYGLSVIALPVLAHDGLISPDVDIPNRENRAALLAHWFDGVGKQKAKVYGLDNWQLSDRLGFFSKFPSLTVSVTDVLRMVTAYSGGSASLADQKPVRLKKMSRPQRRAVMSAMEQAVTRTRDPVSEMFARRNAFLRLGEVIHAGEWTAFPNAVAAFDALRNGKAPPSWHARLDAILSAEKVTDGALSDLSALFADNPGYAARSLRRCLAWAGRRSGKAVSAFEAVAPQVSTPVLLSVRAALRGDSRWLQASKGASRLRVMLPKGGFTRRYTAEGGAMPSKAALAAGEKACVEALMDRFAKLPPLGKVHVEDGLDRILLPKGLREATESMAILSRGSSVPVSASANTVRMFLWWTQDESTGRVDVDLSAQGVSQSGEVLDTCSWQGLRGGRGMVHSGDLTSARNGAAEFVDINLSGLSPSTRYVILAANVFTGQKFADLPECFVGWQERSGKAQKGALHALPAVAEKFVLCAPVTGYTVVAFDVVERRVIWLDAPLNVRTGYCVRGSSAFADAMNSIWRHAQLQPTVLDALELHVKARGGELVPLDEADTVFSLLPPVQSRQGQKVVAATVPKDVEDALLQ